MDWTMSSHVTHLKKFCREGRATDLVSGSMRTNHCPHHSLRNCARSVPSNSFGLLDSWVGLISCLGNVSNYQSMVHNIPEEQIFHLLLGYYPSIQSFPTSTSSTHQPRQVYSYTKTVHKPQRKHTAYRHCNKYIDVIHISCHYLNVIIVKNVN